jgi:hypothetical protein
VRFFRRLRRIAETAGCLLREPGRSAYYVFRLPEALAASRLERRRTPVCHRFAPRERVRQNMTCEPADKARFADDHSFRKTATRPIVGDHAPSATQRHGSHSVIGR